MFNEWEVVKYHLAWEAVWRENAGKSISFRELCELVEQKVKGDDNANISNGQIVNQGTDEIEG